MKYESFEQTSQSVIWGPHKGIKIVDATTQRLFNALEIRQA